MENKQVFGCKTSGISGFIQQKRQIREKERVLRKKTLGKSEDFFREKQECEKG